MSYNFKIYKNKRVLITGHTGFKGTWLSLWLQSIGADVLGISLGVPTIPSTYNIIKLNKIITSRYVDILNYKKLEKTILDFKPDFVFHLAAQPIVMESYKNPILTFNTNVIGTLNILNIIKNIKYKISLILITSDKVYENKETKRGYTEIDILGGLDPYSASKSMTEFGIRSYIKSFLINKKNIKVGIARAGNVIGGGDWSKNRIVPDIMRSLKTKKKLVIRHPNATRPWQHVLEPISGYLTLGQKLNKNHHLSGEAFNFGPKYANIITVEELISKFSFYSNNIKININKKIAREFYESTLLSLNCRKAKKLLNWEPILNINQTVKLTFDWYNEYFYGNKTLIKEKMLFQIKDFINLKNNK